MSYVGYDHFSKNVTKHKIVANAPIVKWHCLTQPAFALKYREQPVMVAPAMAPRNSKSKISKSYLSFIFKFYFYSFMMGIVLFYCIKMIIFLYIAINKNILRLKNREDYIRQAYLLTSGLPKRRRQVWSERIVKYHLTQMVHLVYIMIIANQT